MYFVYSHVAKVLKGPGTHSFICLANTNSGPSTFAPPWALCALQGPPVVQASGGICKQLQWPMCFGSPCTKGHDQAGDVMTHLHVRNVKAAGSPEEVTFRRPGRKGAQHFATHREPCSAHSLCPCHLKVVHVALCHEPKDHGQKISATAKNDFNEKFLNSDFYQDLRTAFSAKPGSCRNIKNNRGAAGEGPVSCLHGPEDWFPAGEEQGPACSLLRWYSSCLCLQGPVGKPENEDTRGPSPGLLLITHMT